MTLATERGSSLTSRVELPFEESKRDAKAVICSLGNRELEKNFYEKEGTASTYEKVGLSGWSYTDSPKIRCLTLAIIHFGQ